MTVPGSNLLRRASRLIRLQKVQYYQFAIRVQNAAFQEVSSFSPPFPLAASVQAVPRNVYGQLGLDLQKDYVNIFASLDMVDLARDVSGDMFVWQRTPTESWLCQMQSDTGWFATDGWAECLAVRVAFNQTPSITP